MRIDPSAWAVGITGCFVDWLITRRWRRILIGFIPLFAAASVGGLVALGSRLDRDKLAERYLELANKEVEDWEKQWAPESADESSGATSPQADPTASASPSTDGSDSDQAKISRFAETLFRRVQQLHPDNQKSVFFIAMTLAQRGSLQLAVARLESIAPEDREGFLPAHVKLAEIFLSRAVTAENLPKVKHHARATMKWERTSPYLLARISELFRQTGEPDMAVQAMTLAAHRDPRFTFALAKLTSTHAKWKLQFDRALPKAEDYFRAEVAAKPQDAQPRLLLADILLMKEDYTGAEQTIVEGLKVKDLPELRRALSEVYRVRFASTSKVTSTSWSGQIELLDRAFRIDPTNSRVFEEVAKLARIGGESPGDELMAQLRKLLADGTATSITHMWMAERYLLSGDMAAAVPHLEQAVKRDPRAAQSWNNLAYCLASLYPDRREEALACADRAVELVPTSPEYHDTRGTVLSTLGRHKDAVAAFERAIELVALAGNEVPPNPGYHQRLAEAYAAVGDTAMAAEHERIAAEKTRLVQQRSAADDANTDTKPDGNAGANTDADADASEDAPAAQKTSQPAPETSGKPDQPAAPDESNANGATEAVDESPNEDEPANADEPANETVPPAATQRQS